MNHIHSLSWATQKPVNLRLAKDKGNRELRSICRQDAFNLAVDELVNQRFGELHDSGTATSGKKRSLAYLATQDMTA